MSKHETQETISKWADETFGEASLIGIATRANKEMAELLHKLQASENIDPDEIVYEVADILIVLYRIPEYLDSDLMKFVDRKMQINRNRRWKLDGSGHAQHID